MTSLSLKNQMPNAENDQGTTLREPAFLARPEDFPNPPSPFQPRGLLAKTESDSYAHFAWTPREISARIFFVHVTPHRAIFLFIIGSTSNFRNPSCAHLLWVIDQVGLGFPEGEIGSLDFFGLLC